MAFGRAPFFQILHLSNLGLRSGAVWFAHGRNVILGGRCALPITPRRYETPFSGSELVPLGASAMLRTRAKRRVE
jgi:hypothetical protein